MAVMERKKSPLNLLLNTVVESRDADFWLQKFNPLWSVHQPLGKIVQKDQSAQDMVSLTIQFNRHFQVGVAGQHHPVYVVIDGIRYERSYSLTQIDAQHVLLTVKKVAEGKVSTWLVEQAQVDDILEFGLPYGDMQLLPNRAEVLLLAAGSGITPMYSLIHQAIKDQSLEKSPIHLMYWVKYHADAVFKAQFEQWAKQYPNFSYQILYTQEAGADERLNAQHLTNLTLNQKTVYACGPAGFVGQVQQLCQEAAHLLTEAFSLNPISSADVGYVNLTLTQSNQTITIPKGQSILVALEQQNIKPKHGCRMGICHKCVCQKVEGSTQNILDGSSNHEPGNALKICVNSAQSDLIIDL